MKPDEVFYYKRPKTERENIAEIREMQRKNYLFEITEHDNPMPLITPFSKVTRYVAVFGGIYGNMLLMRIFERFNDSLHIIENTPHYAHFLKAFDGILQTAKNAIIKDVPEYELKERTFPNESGRVKPKEYEEGEMNTYSSTAYAKRVKHCYEKIVKEITFIEKKVKMYHSLLSVLFLFYLSLLSVLLFIFCLLFNVILCSRVGYVSLFEMKLIKAKEQAITMSMKIAMLKMKWNKRILLTTFSCNFIVFFLVK